MKLFIAVNNWLKNWTQAIDMWTGICLTFAFNTLIEVVLVNYVSRRCKHRAVKKSCHGYAMEMENTTGVALVPDNPPVDDEDKVKTTLYPLLHK